MKTKLIYYGILISLISILIGSVSHLSYTFSSLEPKTDTGIVSFVISCGIEAGMLAVAFGIAERRRLKQSAKDLFSYLIGFGTINFFGNTYFAISVYLNAKSLLKWSDVQGVDPLVLITVGMLSSSLPLLVIALTELLSIFQQKLNSEERKLAEKKKEEDKKRPPSNPTKVVDQHHIVSETPIQTVQQQLPPQPILYPASGKPEMVTVPSQSYEKVPHRVWPLEPDEEVSFEKKILERALEDDGDDWLGNKLIIPRGHHTQFSMA